MLNAIRCTRFLLAACLLAGVPAAAAAQDSAAAPQANPSDVSSVDSIIAALYASISGPVGQARDWDRMRSLFHPEARLMPTGRRPDGTFRARFLTVDDYIGASERFLVENGFREREIARETERYGNIVHAFSTYESYRRDETEPFARGINSIQLWNDGERWWVMNIMWEGERPDNPLPEEYLGR